MAVVKVTMDNFENEVLNSDKKVLVDVKSILNRKEVNKAGYIYWRL